MADLYTAKRNASGEVSYWIDLIYSPDDNGWYATEVDFDVGRERNTKKIYRNRYEVQSALSKGGNIWEKWFYYSRP